MGCINIKSDKVTPNKRKIIIQEDVPVSPGGDRHFSLYTVKEEQSEWSKAMPHQRDNLF
jgi:hypothetical protein